MPVVLLLAALAILAGVVVVAVGRGGELTVFRADASPYGHEFATAADMAAFRPPPAFFGYNAQATDEALRRIARAVADRDTELALLRDQLAALARGADAGADQRDAGDPGYPGGSGYPGGPWFRDEPAFGDEPAGYGEAAEPAEPDDGSRHDETGGDGEPGDEAGAR